MRTTLTLDDDVAHLVEEAMHDRKTSMKEVVNDALRTALAPHVDVTFEPRTFDLKLRPEYRGANPNQLADELEAEEAFRRSLELQ